MKPPGQANARRRAPAALGLVRPYLRTEWAVSRAGVRLLQTTAEAALGAASAKVHVIPVGEVPDAAGQGDLGPVLQQDHPLRPLDEIYPLRLVELLGLGVDEFVELRVGVVGPVAGACDPLGMVEAKGAVRLVVRQGGGEGEVEVAGEGHVHDENAP